MILLGVLAAFLIFVGAVGTLVGTQVADLLADSDRYITDTVDFLNDNFGTNIDPQDVVSEFNDPDGRVQEFIKSQSDEAVRLSLAVVGVIFQGLSVLLFTYYLVADGPRLRRDICSRLTRRARHGCSRRGSWRSRRPVATSIRGRCWRCCRRSSTGSCSSRSARRRRSHSHCGSAWSASSCRWSVPTSPASCPSCLTLVDSPLNALIIIVFIVVYQQIENYFFAPRITARTMELHPAVAFGAALAGASLLGFVGAVLALAGGRHGAGVPGEWGNRYDVVDSHLTSIPPPKNQRTSDLPPATEST